VGPVDVPLPPKLQLSEESPVLDNPTQYQSLIGALIWLVCCTVPILTTSVNQLAQFMACPTELTWRAGIQILAYTYQHLAEMELEIGVGGLELRGYMRMQTL
jgi:hypothetical protein